MESLVFFGDILRFFGIFLGLLLFAVAAVNCGRSLVVQLRVFSDSNDMLDLGGGFFVGIGLFLAAWRLASSCLHSAAFGLALSSSMLLAAGDWRQCYRVVVSGNRRFYLHASSIFGFVVFFSLLTLVPTPLRVLDSVRWDDPWRGMTTIVHGYRAVNIALSAAAADVFPLMRQNVGQSALGEISLLLGLGAPMLAMSLWMAFAHIALFLLNVGIFIKLGLSTRKSMAAALILEFAAAGIGGEFVSLTDTGSVIFFIRNIDTILGLGAFFVAISGFMAIIDGAEHTERRVLLLCVLAWSWSIYASHLSLLWALVVVVLCVLQWGQGRSFARCLVLAALGLLIFFAGAAGNLSNGFQMLTEPNIHPPPYRAAPSVDLLSIRDFVSFNLWTKRAWYVSSENMADHAAAWLNGIVDPLADEWVPEVAGARKVLWHLSRSTVLLCCGLILALPAVLARGRNRVERLSLFSISLMLFVAGAFMATSLDFGIYTHELTRFWSPGSYLCSIFLHLGFSA